MFVAVAAEPAHGARPRRAHPVNGKQSNSGQSLSMLILQA